MGWEAVFVVYNKSAPKLLCLICEIMHIISPFHWLAKERASFGNDFNTASLVWFAYYTEITVLCWAPADCFFSLSSLLSFFYVNTSMLFEACGLRWGKAKACSGPGPDIDLPGPRAGDGGVGTMPMAEKNPAHSGIKGQGPSLTLLLNSCTLLFQRTRNINFLEGFKNAIIAQSPGFCFLPCSLSLSTK